MLSAFLITLREGLEAALIIGIILAYLLKTGRRREIKRVWLGTVAAVAASLAAGAAIYFTAGGLEGRAEEVFEGAAMFLAAGVLTWMVFWMRRQARSIRSELQAKVETAITQGSAWGLFLLAFVAVAREGIETVLFLFATAAVSESPALFGLGAGGGLGAAVVIGYGVYRGTSRLNLRAFFNVTGMLLVLFAAGLLAHGVHEFNEAGLIPPVVEHVWDVNFLLPEGSAAGRVLTALFGYNGNPSLSETVVYRAYLVTATVAYFRGGEGKEPNKRVSGREPTADGSSPA